MTNGQQAGAGAGAADHAGHGFDRSAELAELAGELRQLLETVLERIEPSLRKTAAGIGQAEWDSCSWCPVCAGAALLRGQHHDVVAAVAEHGTAIVTVLREALAGAPVEPRMPESGSGTAGPGGEAASPDAPADTGATPGPGAANGEYTEIPVTIR